MKNIGIITVLCLFTGLVSGDFEIKDPSQPEEMVIEDKNAGKQKHMNADMQFHVETMLVLAEMGVDYAQFQVGTMFDLGQGLDKDPALAAKWYRKAAWQRNKAAQFYLGRMYLDGRGVPKNYDEAYVWLSIAAHNYLAPANYRDIAANKLSAKQLQAAQERAADLYEDLYLQKMDE